MNVVSFMTKNSTTLTQNKFTFLKLFLYLITKNNTLNVRVWDISRFSFSNNEQLTRRTGVVRTEVKIKNPRIRCK